jgi:uncharacterized membrane protein
MRRGHGLYGATNEHLMLTMRLAFDDSCYSSYLQLHVFIAATLLIQLVTLIVFSFPLSFLSFGFRFFVFIVRDIYQRHKNTPEKNTHPYYQRNKGRKPSMI